MTPSPVIVDLCCRKTCSGKSRDYRDVTRRFVKLRFQSVSVHKKTKSRCFQIPPVCRAFSESCVFVTDKCRQWAQPWKKLTIIHRFAAQQISTTFTNTEVNNCFSIYHTSWITRGPKSSFICENIATKAILFFFGCSEVNSTWLITSELANQRARKVLFT